MRQYKTRVRQMRPARSQRERQDEHPQSWFRDEDIARAKAYAEHARETGTLPPAGQES